MAAKLLSPAPPGKHYIFVKSFYHRTAKKWLRASDYGLKAWPLLVSDKER